MKSAKINPFTQKRITAMDIIFMVAFFVCIVLQLSCNSACVLKVSPKQLISNAWVAVTDNGGNTYVVDNGRDRIIQIDSDNKIVMEYSGFAYIDDIAVDDAGNIYVIDTQWEEDGFLVTSDILYKYDADRDEMSILYMAEYENATKHQMFALNVANDGMHFVIADSAHLYHYCTGPDEKTTLVASYDIEKNPVVFYQDIDLNVTTGDIYALDKTGCITRYYTDASGNVCSENFFDWSVINEREMIEPYRMDVTSDGSVYFADIVNNRIYRVIDGKDSVMYAGDFMYNVKVSEHEGYSDIAIMTGGKVVLLNESGELKADIYEVNYCTSIYIKYLLLVLLFAANVLLLLYLLPRIIYGISLKVNTPLAKIRILLIASILLVAGVMVFQSTSSFRTMLTSEEMYNLEYIAHNIAEILDPEDIANINTTTDYYNDSFVNIVEDMKHYIDYNYDSGMYCNLVRYDSTTGQVYDVVFLDDSVGTYYPLSGNEADEIIKIYETGETITSGSQTENGGFTYVKVPVTVKAGNENHVVAVVEIGTWSYVIENQIRRMMTDMLLNLAVWIILIIFIFTEGFEIIALRNDYRKKLQTTEETENFPLHLSRGMIFLVFMAYNLPTAFLPVYVASMYDGTLSFLPEGIAKSVPISINMALLGVTALLGFFLLKKLSFRRAMLISAMATLAGDLILALAGNYGMIIAGLVLNGIGVGFQMNLLHTVTTYAAEKEKDSTIYTVYQAGSLSGIMVGMSLGAILADYLGYKKVFFITVAIWAVVSVVAFINGKKLQLKGVTDTPKGEVKKKENVFKFIFTPKILLFLVLMLFMYVMTSSFIYYYVPIYCDSMGYSSTVSCIMILISSICGIYLSASTTKFFQKNFGQYAIYISSIIALVALLLFAYFKTSNMLLISIFIMGFGTSFGTATRLSTFSEFEATRKFGVERATGIYDLIERVGEAVGPMLFASLLTGDFTGGIDVFVVISIGACLLYFMSSLIGNRKKNK